MKTGYIIWLLICAVLGCCLCHWLNGLDAEVVIIEPQHLPSLDEIQTMIGVEPDGIYGPETKAAWDKAICQQYADKIDMFIEDK